jgi:general secretion pathway protein K
MPLFSVLWGMALMSLVAVSLLTTSATSLKLTRNALESAQADAVADAAVVRAVVGLTEQRLEKRWYADGRSTEFVLRGVNARVEIQDELGRIDLNHADRSLLLGLIQSTGEKHDLANSIVESILSRRGGGRLQSFESRPRGAGNALNVSSKKQLGPFQRVDELRAIPGMTPKLYKQIAPALTVYSQRQMVDPQLASPEVLLALPGMTPERARHILSEREDNQLRLLRADEAAALGGRAFSLRISVERPGGKRSYLAVIRLTDNPRKPFWLLDWQDKFDI